MECAPIIDHTGIELSMRAALQVAGSNKAPDGALQTR
jgi:hypothetical protein